MKISSFRDLRVWQIAMDITEEVYKLTLTFPNQEQYVLVSQMRRAAISIPSNIAEGYVRESTKEYLQFLSVAQASLAELQTQMEIAERLNYLARQQAGTFLDQTVSLSRQLYALRNALRKKEG